MTRPIESDRFGITIERILSKIGKNVEEYLPDAIHKGVKRGAVAWRREAKEKFEPGSRTYRKHGKTYTIGAYSKSIRSHMLSKSGPRPSGEVGVPSMPGLPHLLEDGHAKVGGGRVLGIKHIEPAVTEAFDATVKEVNRAVEEALDDI